MEDPEIKELYKTIWGQFRADSMDALLEYVDFYSSLIIQSHSDDYQVWSKTPNFSGTSNYSYKINQLKSWLTNRADYIDRYVNDF